jgi:hypothetical protein
MLRKKSTSFLVEDLPVLVDLTPLFQLNAVVGKRQLNGVTEDVTR